MKIIELTGPHLDYLTARAVGIPAEQLSIRQVPRTDKLICVYWPAHDPFGLEVRAYSTDYALAGPLIDQYRMQMLPGIGGTWWAQTGGCRFIQADTLLDAVCRALVHCAIGKGDVAAEVEEVPVNE